MEVYEAFAHDVPVRLYLGLAVSVAAVVAAALAVGVLSYSRDVVEMKRGTRCAELGDVGALRMMDGRPQICRP